MAVGRPALEQIEDLAPRAGSASDGNDRRHLPSRRPALAMEGGEELVAREHRILRERRRR